MLLNNFYEGTPVNIVNIDAVTLLNLNIIETSKNWWAQGWEIWNKESFAPRNEENNGSRKVMFRVKKKCEAKRDWTPEFRAWTISYIETVPWINSEVSLRGSGMS